MSQEQLEAFMSKVHKDKSLQERLKNSTSNDEVRAIAREHGHEISLDAKLKPLSQGELEEVAGGGLVWKPLHQLEFEQRHGYRLLSAVPDGLPDPFAPVVVAGSPAATDPSASNTDQPQGLGL